MHFVYESQVDCASDCYFQFVSRIIVTFGDTEVIFCFFHSNLDKNNIETIQDNAFHGLYNLKKLCVCSKFSSVGSGNFIHIFKTCSQSAIE